MKQHDIDILCNAINTTGKTKEIKLAETHISWVILTRKYAYKIKKPVKFSFLDFSSLEKRKHFCLKELQLNQRLAKSMYIAVTPVFKKNGIVTFDLPGEIADYAVVMKRMNNNVQMNKLVQSGKITSRMISSLAKKIAAFHQQAEVISGEYDIGSLQSRFNDTEGVYDKQDRNYKELIEKAIAYSDNFLKQHGDILLRRKAAGYIRDVHGDFHTGNIFLYRDPVIFDCIEFNDDMRRIDILDEVAFLCMDLESYGRNDLSDLFYKNYLRFLGIPATKDMDIVFGYFKLYRANVRAKVAMIATQKNLVRGGYPFNKCTADRYLNLIRTYLTNMPR